MIQNVTRDYDTYDSCVVVANNVEEAVNVHPNNRCIFNGKSRVDKDGDDMWYAEKSWCNPKCVHINLIGVTDLYNKSKVICSSFNAG